MRRALVTPILLVGLYLISTSSIFHELAGRAMVSVYGEANDWGRSLTPVETIIRDGYPGESHEVTTEDGYILTMYRIRGPPGSVPVYLQHGLLESSAGWLTLGPGRSLAYILADRGYDVWLGNARGNTFSRKHRTLNETDAEFWEFSWQELGTYDLPAVISYIVQLKKDRLFYVGHSMGAISFSVMAVERPDVARHVRAAFALAPSTYIRHVRSPIGLLSYVWRPFRGISSLLGVNRFLPRGRFYDYVARYVCESTMLQGVCSNTLFLIGGFSYEQLDNSLLPKIWSNIPAGTSVKLFTHWLQQMRDNTLRKFDYGADENLRLYNSTTPPRYDLSRIEVPLAVIWSENDWLIGPEDAQQFYDEVPMKIGSYRVEEEGFNHCDFLWGVGAPELVYSKILGIMADFDD